MLESFFNKGAGPQANTYAKYGYIKGWNFDLEVYYG